MALVVDSGGRRIAAPSPSGSSLPPDLAQLIASQMAGTSGGAPTGYLYISLDGKPVSEGRKRRRGTGYITQPTGQRYSTIEEAVDSWYALNDQYRQQIQNRMWFLGLIDGPNNEAQASRAWSAAVEQSWKYKRAGKDIDPVTMLGRMSNLKAGQLGPGGQGAQGPRTQTQRNVNFTDPAQATAWIREAFQSSMGRDPHPAEIRAMLGAIAEGNRDKPQVVQTTTDAEGNSTSKVLDPGFDPTSYITNDLADDAEGAAYQAAGTLFPALLEALQSPV